MDKHLHIISLDIPYPADYGGVIDIFYKLKHLQEAGIEITLHCFEYGERTQQEELKKYCKQVFYYKRIIGWKGLDATLPYIISSRRSKELLRNLQKDHTPILFEGLHTTYYASHPSLKDRKKILRAHNIESSYYAELAKNTKTWFKQLYYSFESNRLHHYENVLPWFDYILSISEQDYDFHVKKYPSSKNMYLPAFQQNDHVNSKQGKGDYCLYHGNLSVEENIRAVEFLTNSIFNKLDFKLIIAGKNPNENLTKLDSGNIRIIANPSHEELNNLISNAQINVIPAFQQSGLKLKLLNALFNGRHCVINGEIESKLLDTIHLVKTEQEWIEKITLLMTQPFGESDIEKRVQSLQTFTPSYLTSQLLETLS